MHEKVGTSNSTKWKKWGKSERWSPQKLGKVQVTQSTGRETEIGERTGCTTLSFFDWKSRLPLILAQLVGFFNVRTQFEKRKRKIIKFCEGEVLTITHIHRIPKLLASDIVSENSTGCMKISPYWFEIEDVQTFWSIPMQIMRIKWTLIHKACCALYGWTVPVGLVK